MARSYKAARRAAKKQPVEFDFAYVTTAEVRDEEGDLIGTEEVDRTVHFVCKGEVSTLLLSELSYNADLDVSDPAAVKLIRDFFAQAFGVTVNLEEQPDGSMVERIVHDEAYATYQKFFRLQTTYGDDDLLMEIMAGLVEDFSGRPTMQPSVSAGEPVTTGATSKVVSLSQATVRPLQQGETVPGEVVEESSQTASSG